MTWEIVALHALRLSVPADSIRWDGKEERADACAREEVRVISVPGFASVLMILPVRTVRSSRRRCDVWCWCCYLLLE